MIRVKGLTKRYKKLIAVDALTLEIGRGKVFGFIGPNGAGKTTTIRMIATLLMPDAGSIEVDGLDTVQYPLEVRRRIGYMPDSFGVYDDMLVWEYLDFFGAAYDLPAKRRRAMIGEVLELVNLAHKRDTPVQGLSRGMKQSLCLAKTLLHDPPVLLLDEPASGLDPRARIEFRELVKELRRMGKTILISSHILTELADFCTDIGIIERGTLIVSGPVADMSQRLRSSHIYHLRVRNDADGALRTLLELPFVVAAACEAGWLRVQLGEDAEDAGDAVTALVHAGFSVIACEAERSDLERIFMQVTEGIVG